MIRCDIGPSNGRGGATNLSVDRDDRGAARFDRHSADLRRRLADHTRHIPEAPQADGRGGGQAEQQSHAAGFRHALESHPQAKPIPIGVAQIATKLLNGDTGTPRVGASLDETVPIFVSLAKIATEVLNTDFRMSPFVWPH